MSKYLSENEFRDFLRRFLIVQHQPNGVLLGFDVIEAERSLASWNKLNQKSIMNEAMEFLRQVAEKVVAEVKDGLKGGDPFPYPVTE